MLTKTEKQQVACLRNFLVPKDGPDRLVKNWKHIAETEDGIPVSFLAMKNAERFCVLGGWSYLYPDSMQPLAPELDRVAGGHFDSATPHTAEEIRELLNKLIEE